MYTQIAGKHILIDINGKIVSIDVRTLYIVPQILSRDKKDWK